MTNKLPDVARVRLRNPEYTKGGDLYVEPELLQWSQVEFLSQFVCHHTESMCILCLTQWSSDYQIEINGERVKDLELLFNT